MLVYLLELRKRCIKTLIVFFIIFSLCFYKANVLYLWVTKPCITALSHSLIVTDLTASFLTPLKLAMRVAMVMILPFALWQLWGFVLPALYQKEKWPFRYCFALSLTLFIIGLSFGFYVVLPPMFQFFIQALPANVSLLPDMTSTLDFITTVLLFFGLAFQLPLFCFVLVQIGLLKLKQLQLFRPYMIVLAFIVGMVLTPPDVFSQILMAIPLCLLYEVGILFCRLTAPKIPKKPQKRLK